MNIFWNLCELISDIFTQTLNTDKLWNSMMSQICISDDSVKRGFKFMRCVLDHHLSQLYPRFFFFCFSYICNINKHVKGCIFYIFPLRVHFEYRIDTTFFITTLRFKYELSLGFLIYTHVTARPRLLGLILHSFFF